MGGLGEYDSRLASAALAVVATAGKTEGVGG